ncbi:MAG: tRNA (adenosine(37)-N6)-threonylcarbamoyltransferase complex transferase subunit TsaD [Deferribacteraceae bacterium]|jgi:N6-L-threonylcarbamoyladenine synthase|nr:tRNA (adenosine(37)-N6)-threonylcarbamoyltransferase complex transferase subunit TsaD [Deferribacteraceae bacterium]
MNIVGIETSCDETSVAVLSGAHILSSFTFSQADIHAVFGGVVPEVASRNHMQKIAPLFRKAMAHAGLDLQDIDLIAVTSAPGLIGALFVGVSFAKGLAFAMDKPIIPIHHLAGHILSAELSNPELKPPYTALVVSGGHTHIYDVTEENGQQPSFRLIGRTIDDAAGEAFDKVAKMLGGQYPGGPFIEKLAMDGDSQSIKFPIALRGEQNLSFSGLKTAVLTKIEQHTHEAKDIAASFQYTVAKTVQEKAFAAAKAAGRNKIVVTGGVSCNGALRRHFAQAVEAEGLQVYFPEIQLCNDNAAMIAYAAYRMTQNTDIAEYKDLSFAAGDTRHEIDVA